LVVNAQQDIAKEGDYYEIADGLQQNPH